MAVAGKRDDYPLLNCTNNSDTFCDICKIDGKETKAEGLCEECEEFMCVACFESHCKAKLCRHHKLVNSGEPLRRCLVENVEKCTRHANEMIKYYCRTHDIVGCGECMIPVHIKCKPQSIESMLTEFNNDMLWMNKLKMLHDLWERNEQNANILEADRVKNRKMKDQALKSIRQFYAEIKDYLNKSKIKLEKELQNIVILNNKELLKLESERTNVSSSITKVSKMLDTETYQDSKLFIQFVQSKSLILDIERFVKRIETGNCIKKFQFVPDKSLQCLTKSRKNPGKIETIDSDQDQTLPTNERSSDKEDDLRAVILRKKDIAPQRRSRRFNLSDEKESSRDSSTRHRKDSITDSKSDTENRFSPFLSRSNKELFTWNRKDSITESKSDTENRFSPILPRRSKALFTRDRKDSITDSKSDTENRYSPILFRSSNNLFTRHRKDSTTDSKSDTENRFSPILPRSSKALFTRHRKDNITDSKSDTENRFSPILPRRSKELFKRHRKDSITDSKSDTESLYSPSSSKISQGLKKCWGRQKSITDRESDTERRRSKSCTRDEKGSFAESEGYVERNVSILDEDIIRRRRPKEEKKSSGRALNFFMRRKKTTSKGNGDSGEN